VQIDSQFVVDELKKQGESDRVQKAIDELPAKIDHPAANVSRQSGRALGPLMGLLVDG
jgi:tetrahydromethanopterin S-methyltransferase subunit G